jgi:hypothetical protein
MVFLRYALRSGCHGQICEFLNLRAMTHVRWLVKWRLTQLRGRYGRWGLCDATSAEERGPCPLETRNCTKHKQIGDFLGTSLFSLQALPVPVASLGYVFSEKTALYRAKKIAFLLSLFPTQNVLRRELIQNLLAGRQWGSDRTVARQAASENRTSEPCSNRNLSRWRERGPASILLLLRSDD